MQQISKQPAFELGQIVATPDALLNQMISRKGEEHVWRDDSSSSGVISKHYATLRDQCPSGA
jgi:hypothetical protein